MTLIIFIIIYGMSGLLLCVATDIYQAADKNARHDYLCSSPSTLFVMMAVWPVFFIVLCGIIVLACFRKNHCQGCSKILKRKALFCSHCGKETNGNR